MPYINISPPISPGDDASLQDSHDFERWRTAVELFNLFRKLGVDCELQSGLSTRDTN